MIGAGTETQSGVASTKMMRFRFRTTSKTGFAIGFDN
jgi:hypothetical protein